MAKRDFVSMISHDLRSPLMSLYGSLELIATYDDTTSGAGGAEAPDGASKAVALHVVQTCRVRIVIKIEATSRQQPMVDHVSLVPVPGTEFLAWSLTALKLIGTFGSGLR